MSDMFYTGTFEFTQPAKGLFGRRRVETKTLMFTNVHPAMYDSLILAGPHCNRRMMHHAEITREEAEALTAAYQVAGRHDDLLDLSKIVDIVRKAPTDGLSEISAEDDMEDIRRYAELTGQELPDQGTRFGR